MELYLICALFTYITVLDTENVEGDKVSKQVAMFLAIIFPVVWLAYLVSRLPEPPKK